MGSTKLQPGVDLSLAYWAGLAPLAYGGVGLLCPGCAQLLFAQPKPSGSSELAATWFALLAITFFFSI